MFLKICTRIRVNGLKNHIKQNPVGTSTSRIIHDTPLITKNPRPSKGRVLSYMGFVNYIVYNCWENLIILWFKRYIWKQEGSCTWASERGCTGCRVSHALVYISITQCGMIMPISPDIWPCMRFSFQTFFQVEQRASSKDLWHTKFSNRLKTSKNYPKAK